MGKRKNKPQQSSLRQTKTPAQVETVSRFFTGNGYAVTCGVLFIFAAIPLLLMLPYLTPAADDFSYAALAHHASTAGGSWSDIAVAALQQAKISYETWQGTYSSLFLFSFTTIIKSFAYYKWEVLLMQCVFLGGIVLLTYQLLCFFRVMERKNAIATALLAAGFVIAFIPGVGEGLLWRNSMVIYSLAIGAQSIAISLMLLLYRANTSIKKICWMLPILLLLAYLGGSNYITALCTCFGLFLLCGWLFWRKNPQKWYFVVMLLVAFAGLLITVTAPGNSGRAVHFEQNDPFTAVFLSFPGAVQFLFITLRDSLLIPLTTFIVVATLPALRKTSFQFPYPLAVVGLSFVWFAAHFTPTLYAASSTFFEMRIMNTYFISFCFLFVLNAVYLTGWCLCHGLNRGYTQKETQWGMAVLCGFATVLVALAFQPQENSYTAMWHDVLTPAGRDYNRYVLQTCENIAASSETDVAVPEYSSVLPWALKDEFIMIFQNDWRNQAVATYYQKNSVQLASE